MAPILIADGSARNVVADKTNKTNVRTNTFMLAELSSSSPKFSTLHVKFEFQSHLASRLGGFYETWIITFFVGNYHCVKLTIMVKIKRFLGFWRSLALSAPDH